MENENDILSKIPLDIPTGPYLLGYAQAVYDLNKDWDAFRREAAKDFMTAIISREAPQYDFACRNVSIRVSEAIMWADELIKQLKDEKTG